MDDDRNIGRGVADARAGEALERAAASGAASFETAQWLAGSWIGRLVLFGYTFALMHHMVGGLRHFVWDLGHGYGAETRMNMARMTLFVSVPLTILIWFVAYAVR